MNTKLRTLLVALALANLFADTSGHGMLMDPVNRASRWRFDTSSPRDYNDMEGFCGGFAVQWNQNGGKCGLCGDNYANPTPRAHELGGTFGQGVIVKSYARGSKILVSAKLTANHRGYFYFRLCNLDVGRESEACFELNKIKFTDGSDTYLLPSTAPGDYSVSIQLPSNLVCNHCVLQWTYVAGNNWGYCSDGSGKLGCGPQEHFRTCSDIRIY